MFKKILSVAIITLLLFSNLGAVRAQAAAPHQATFGTEDYSILYTVTPGWAGSNTHNVTLKNTSGRVLYNWGVGFETNSAQPMTNLWGAQNVYRSDEYLIFIGAGWNSNLNPGDSTSFAFTMQSDTVFLPQQAVLCDPVKTEAEDIQMSFELSSSWQTGFAGFVTLKNTGAEPVNGWVAEFDFSSNITNVYEAVLSDSFGGS